MTAELHRRLYPEMNAGGFTRHEHRVVFFARVRALLGPSFSVLDFGAGRAGFLEWETPTARRVTDLRGSVEKLTAFDVDPVVLDNPQGDECVYRPVGAPLPFDDQSFDLILSWAVFEHIQDSHFYASELARVLKPGGWLCAWTPNKWGYVGMGARLIPNRWHASLLRYISPHRQEKDIFPTVYKMNTFSDLRRLFPEEEFVHASYKFTGPPVYHANNIGIARFWIFLNWLPPSSMRQSLLVFPQKKPA